jgi:hypothetical protein
MIFVLFHIPTNFMFYSRAQSFFLQKKAIKSVKVEDFIPFLLPLVRSGFCVHHRHRRSEGRYHACIYIQKPCFLRFTSYAL